MENIIVIHDKKIAQGYKSEVLRLLNRRESGTVTLPRRGINGVGKVQTFDVNIESGGAAMKQVEITLPYFWRIQSQETVTATRGDGATPVALRLVERQPSRESKDKVQILLAESANLTADGPDSKLSVHLGAVNLDPKTHTGRYCIYVRGSDAAGKLQTLPTLPILWLFRSTEESIAETTRLLNSDDPRSAKDLEYVLRDLSSSLYQEIDTGKLGSIKAFVDLMEKTASAKNSRFKLVSNMARLVCQRLVAAYGVDGNSGDEGAALAARLKETLSSGGVALKPPRRIKEEAPPATEEGFKADLVEALRRYHNTDGKGNGGSVTGLQLPPGVKSLAALEKEIDKLATWLTKRKEIVFQPSPEGVRALSEHRRKIAFERRKDVSGDANSVMTRGIACVGDAKLKKALEAALAAAPAEFYGAPSSSSGKHHPADEINPGGLALHSVRDLIFGRILCDYYGVKGHERDEILAALLLHDIKKGGEPWNNYDPAHGPIGAKWLGTVWESMSSPALDRIRSLVHNHMAQWNAPQPTPPADLANQIVSYADYLASLDGFYVTVP